MNNTNENAISNLKGLAVEISNRAMGKGKVLIGRVAKQVIHDIVETLASKDDAVAVHFAINHEGDLFQNSHHFLWESQFGKAARVSKEQWDSADPVAIEMMNVNQAKAKVRYQIAREIVRAWKCIQRERIQRERIANH